MSGHDDEQLIGQLKQLKHTIPAPRQEFVTYVDQMLANRAKKMKQRNHLKHVATSVGGIAATVTLAVSLASYSRTEPFQKADFPQQNESQHISAVQPEMSLPIFPVKPTPGPLPSEKIDQPKTVGQEQTKTAQTVTTENPDSHGAIVGAAADYLQKKLGAERKNYENDAVLDKAQKEVTFRRLIHGIPVEHNGVTIQLGENGEPAGLTIHESFDPAHDLSLFPQPSNAMTQDNARQVLAKSVLKQPSLRYELPHIYVNALTGELLDGSGQPLNSGDQQKIYQVTAKGKQLIASSADEAADLLKTEFGLALTRENLVYTTNYRDEWIEYIWKLDESTFVTTKWSAQNNHLLSYKVEKQGSTGKQVNVSTGKAEEIALTNLMRYLHKTIKEVHLLQSTSEGTATRFNFACGYEGSPVIDRSYEVWIDNNTGEMVGIEGDFAKEMVELQKLDSERSSKGEPEFLQNHQLELVYVWPERNGKRTDTPYLVYRLKE